MAKLPICEFEGKRLIMRLSLTLKADLSEIPPVVERVMSVVRSMQCAEARQDDIQVSLAEALANAVEHGCGQDSEKEVQLCVACDEKRGMLLVVRDPGEGFDPAEIPNPTVGKNLYLEGGRGIYLINQLMDEVEYEDGGTTIRLRAE
jgi:serine/threonine-protein kinase RsbW